jgi:hypothetical protein
MTLVTFLTFMPGITRTRTQTTRVTEVSQSLCRIELEVSDTPFDSWYRKEMRRLFRCDFARLPRIVGSKFLFAWREASGEREQESAEG